MSLNEELKNILTDTERFLKQQQELYGELIFKSISDPLPVGTTQIPFSPPTVPADPEIDFESSGHSVCRCRLLNYVGRRQFIFRYENRITVQFLLLFQESFGIAKNIFEFFVERHVN